jgi:NADH-quinone oxidoreductase subunit N
MFNVVVSLHYYLLAIKAAYLTEPVNDLPPIQLSVGERLLAGALVTVTVCAGIFPTPLLELAEAAVRSVI